MIIICTALLTVIMAILTPLLMIRSCYYSERNYKKGKFYWRTSLITGFIYSVSFWVTSILLVIKSLIIIFQ